MAESPPRRPFDKLSNDTLLDLGVPQDWATTVLGASEDDFLAIADHLPPEAAEALLEFAATGMMPKPSVALQAPPALAEPPEERVPAPRLDFAASPDTLRRFRVVENVTELEAALAYARDVLGSEKVFPSAA